MIFKIENKLIGKDQPIFFIAEAGVNHNGSVELGKDLIDVAVDAGADAVKFQTFDPLNFYAKEFYARYSFQIRQEGPSKCCIYQVQARARTREFHHTASHGERTSRFQIHRVMERHSSVRRTFISRAAPCCGFQI